MPTTEAKPFESKSVRPPENKAGATPPGEVRAAFDELQAAFTAFRETNDARIQQIEGRLSADV